MGRDQTASQIRSEVAEFQSTLPGWGATMCGKRGLALF